MIKYGCLILALFFINNSYAEIKVSKARAVGHETGNGAEFKDFFSDSAWFVEDKIINYCVVRDEGFVVSYDKLEKAVSYGLKKWAEKYSKFKKEEKEYFIQTNYQYNRGCNSNIDLTFYFGGAPTEISKILDKNKSSIALAYPYKFNDTNTWSKGFVYIKDTNIIEDDEVANNPIVVDWSKDNNIYAIVLHEIGHVFGVGHIPQTIMAKSLASDLILEDELEMSKELKKKIDHLYTLGLNEYSKLISNVSDGIKTTVEFKKINKFTITKEERNKETKLYFTGTTRTYVSSIFDVFNNDEVIFKRIIFKDQSVISSSYLFERFILNGVFEINNKVYPGVYHKNIGESSHLFKVFKDGKWSNVTKF